MGLISQNLLQKVTSTYMQGNELLMILLILINIMVGMILLMKKLKGNVAPQVLHVYVASDFCGRNKSVLNSLPLKT